MRKFLEIIKIQELNEIQTEAIQKGLLFHQNFLVCTPSGSGKTLIGLLAIVNAVIQGQKCVYLVPYKALAAEKETQFQTAFDEMSAVLKQFIEIKALTGDSEQDVNDALNYDILITTYEKCDSLMRQPNSIIGWARTIVADEIHEIASDSRGGRIEMLIARILSTLPFVQFIALSATIENIREFQAWLSSFSRPFILLFSTRRPVPLEYSLVVAPNKLKEIKRLVVETVSKHGQILIFVNRRADCVEYAQLLKNIVKSFMAIEDTNKCNKGKNVLIAYRSVADVLKETIEFGVGYHNASLSAHERHIVESLYRERALKVLVATTTLAAGINTPARLVIIENIIQTAKYINLQEGDFKDPSFHLALGTQGVIKPHSANILFQMLGRAGRPGWDAIGNGVILLKSEEERRFARQLYFCSETDATGNLIPKYADLSSKLNNPGVLAEILLIKINSAPEVSLAEIVMEIEKSLFFFLLKRKFREKWGVEAPEHDVVKFLFIKKMDLGYFLRLHSSAYLEDYTHHVTEVTPTSIRGEIKTNKSYYHYHFDMYNGVHCSCNPTKWFRGTSINDNYAFTQLCRHLSTAIHDFHTGVHQKYRPTLELLLPIIFKHEYILDRLIENGMIVQVPHSTSYRITQFGKLALSLYLLPNELMWVYKRLSLFPFDSPEQFLSVVLEYHATASTKDRKKREQLAASWIEEYSVESILQDMPAFGVGDLFNIKNELARSAGIFEAVANFMGKNAIAHQFLVLSLRLKHGIKEELIDLMERFPSLSRNRARILFNAGITNRVEAEKLSPLEIHRQTQIPLAKVKEFLGESKKQHPGQLSLVEFLTEKVAE